MKDEAAMNVSEKLFSMQDPKFKAFQTNLCPSISSENIIGVRTPPLRKFAKELLKSNSYADFLSDLPHRYFEENQLHGFIISEIKDYDTVLAELEKFLPYIDNWATCDQTRPKVFKSHRIDLIDEINSWISSDKTYTIRFGIGMMMEHYLDEDFKEEYLDIVAAIRSGEYYVNMMLAWYFATTLAKRYSSAVIYLEEKRLDTWVHNKTIQKARESFRISAEQKEYLKSLKR